VGPVSGGYVKDDLIARIRAGQGSERPELITYVVSKEKAARSGLPCGGTLQVLPQTVECSVWLREILALTVKHELVARTLDLSKAVS
jgi:xanthine dehydrogenase accessory factor